MQRLQGERGLRRAGWAVLLVGLAALAGCGPGDGLAREPISGTVTLDGKPLDVGQVDFYPDQGSATPITAGAPIKNGAFSIPKEEGLVPGSYTVRLSSAGEMPKKGLDSGNMPGTGEIHAKERFPAKYNSASTLKADVKAGTANKFAFDAQSK